MSPTDSVFDEFNPTDFDQPGPPLEPEEPPARSRKRREPITALEVREGMTRLYRLSDIAFMTLEDAMRNADHATATKAAQIVLDRSGFGPKTTVDVNTTHMELSELTLEQLAERAGQLRTLIMSQRRLPINVTPEKVA